MIKYDDTTNESEEYKEFIEKFKPKKTTDDCYTPENVFKAILDWAVKEYGLEGRRLVRPFWPGADYTKVEYRDGDVVIDNPPFSILSQICAYYTEKKVDYFLFAPNKTLFSTFSGKANYIAVNNDITFQNGAKIYIGFITNMGKYKVMTRPDLHEIIQREEEKNTKPENPLPKYDYPDEVITAARMGKICRYVDLRILPEDAVFIRCLDEQKKRGAGIYGCGFLLKEKAAAEKAAAEKAAAEKAAATRWKLSDRERALLM